MDARRPQVDSQQHPENQLSNSFGVGFLPTRVLTLEVSFQYTRNQPVPTNYGFRQMTTRRACSILTRYDSRRPRTACRNGLRPGRRRPPLQYDKLLPGSAPHSISSMEQEPCEARPKRRRGYPTPIPRRHNPVMTFRVSLAYRTFKSHANHPRDQDCLSRCCHLHSRRRSVWNA